MSRISIEPNEILDTEHIIAPTEQELLMQEFNLLFEMSNEENDEEPVANRDSVVSEEPVTNEEPITNEEPVANGDPVVSEEPITNEEPVEIQSVQQENTSTTETPIRTVDVQEDIVIDLSGAQLNSVNPIETKLSFFISVANTLMIQKYNQHRSSYKSINLSPYCEYPTIVGVIPIEELISILFISGFKNGNNYSGILKYVHSTNEISEIVHSVKNIEEGLLDNLNIISGHSIIGVYSKNNIEEEYLCWKDAINGVRILNISKCNNIPENILPWVKVNLLYQSGNEDIQWPSIEQMETAWESWIEQNEHDLARIEQNEPDFAWNIDITNITSTTIPEIEDNRTSEIEVTDDDVPSIDEFLEIDGVEEQYNFEQQDYNEMEDPENIDFYNKVLAGKDDFSLWAKENNFNKKIYTHDQPSTMTIIYYKVINENYFLIGRKVNFYINRFVTDLAITPIEKYFIQDAIFWKYKIRDPFGSYRCDNGELNISFKNSKKFIRSLPHSRINDFNSLNAMNMCFGGTPDLGNEIKTDSLSELIESMYLITESRLPFMNDQHIAYPTKEEVTIISQLKSKPITLFKNKEVEDFVTPFIVKTEMDNDILNPRICIDFGAIKYEKTLNEFIEMNNSIKEIDYRTFLRRKKYNYTLNFTFINDEVKQITISSSNDNLMPNYIGYHRMDANKIRKFIIPYLELAIKNIRPAANYVS